MDDVRRMAVRNGFPADIWNHLLSNVTDNEYFSLRRALRQAREGNPPPSQSVPREWRHTYEMVVMGQDREGLGTFMTGMLNL
jgi:hypothetical protein